MPFSIGIPSAPGKVPKYESNDRFSCMITMTCLMEWIDPRWKGGVGDGDGDGEPVGLARELLAGWAEGKAGWVHPEARNIATASDRDGHRRPRESPKLTEAEPGRVMAGVRTRQA